MLRVARGAPIAAEAQARLDRRALVSLNIGRAIADLSQPFVLDPARPTTSPTVTPLHPSLRWEPVSSPVLVPRKRYTEGESLRVLIGALGVVQNPTTLALKVVSPANYAAAANAAVPNAGYDAINERHLAPPRLASCSPSCTACSIRRSAPQLHPTSEDARLDAARERHVSRHHARGHRQSSGSLSPAGIALVHVGTPTEALVEDLDNLPPGDPLAPGQTVVHDVDELALPYLAGSVARGVSLAFSEAAQDRTIAFPFGSEYSPPPTRVVGPRSSLSGSNSRAATNWTDSFAERCLTLSLPAGDIPGVPPGEQHDAQRSQTHGAVAQPARQRAVQRRCRRSRSRWFVMGTHALRRGAAGARRRPPARGAAPNQADTHPR